MVMVMTASAEETLAAGERFGQELLNEPVPSIILLYGPLGAGKTELVRGIAKGYGGVDPLSVSSPTYAYLNRYHALRSIYHFDLYRLLRGEEFFLMGFDDSFGERETLHLIEWPQLIVPFLMQQSRSIEITILEGDRRILDFGD